MVVTRSPYGELFGGCVFSIDTHGNAQPIFRPVLPHREAYTASHFAHDGVFNGLLGRFPRLWFPRAYKGILVSRREKRSHNGYYVTFYLIIQKQYAIITAETYILCYLYNQGLIKDAG